MNIRIALLSALTLAACDQAEEPPVVAETEPAEQVMFAPDEARFDADQPGATNEYSYIDLLALEPNDGTLIAGGTTGAGFCFFEDESGRALLTVGAPTQGDKPGQGVVRPNGKAPIVVYAQSGGPDYLSGGPTMEREAVEGEIGMTVTVLLAEADSSATLTVSIPEGERDPYQGTWNCPS